MAAGTVQGGLRVVWWMLILCAMASHEPKKNPFAGAFQKSGSVMHCAYVLAQTLYLDVRAGHTLRHPLCGPLESGHTFRPSPVYIRATVQTCNAELGCLLQV